MKNSVKSLNANFSSLKVHISTEKGKKSVVLNYKDKENSVHTICKNFFIINGTNCCVEEFKNLKLNLTQHLSTNLCDTDYGHFIIDQFSKLKNNKDKSKILNLTYEFIYQGLYLLAHTNMILSIKNGHYDIVIEDVKSIGEVKTIKEYNPVLPYGTKFKNKKMYTLNIYKHNEDGSLSKYNNLNLTNEDIEVFIDFVINRSHQNRETLYTRDIIEHSGLVYKLVEQLGENKKDDERSILLLSNIVVEYELCEFTDLNKSEYSKGYCLLNDLETQDIRNKNIKFPPNGVSGINCLGDIGDYLLYIYFGILAIKENKTSNYTAFNLVEKLYGTKCDKASIIYRIFTDKDKVE